MINSPFKIEETAKAARNEWIQESTSSYIIQAELDPLNHRIVGNAEIEFCNRSFKPVHDLYVHLYLNAFKSDNTVFFRNNISGFRGAQNFQSYGDIEISKWVIPQFRTANLWKSDATTEGDPNDQTDIHLILPNEIAPGSCITNQVTWTSRLPQIQFRTGYVDNFHMIAQWFPKIAKLESDGTFAHFPFERLAEFYSDFGHYDVTVKVPSSYLIGASGSVRSVHCDEITCVHRFEAEGIHDFAFAAWDQFVEEKILIRGIGVRFLYPRGYEKTILRAKETILFGLKYFEDTFGKYPYETLTVIHSPKGAEDAGGMEYPTLITTSGSQWSRFLPARSIESVTLHELAHQWFYGLVATHEAKYPVLDEGLTSFAEMDALSQWFENSSGGNVAGISWSQDAWMRLFQEGDEHVKLTQAAKDFADGNQYVRSVYMRMATILRSMELVYGRTEVMAALNDYATSNRWKHPVPEDLVNAFERHVSKDAAQNLEIAMMKSSAVDYFVEKVESKLDPSTQEYVSEIVVRKNGLCAFPVDIRTEYENGEFDRRVWDAKTDILRFFLRHSNQIVSVSVDGDHRVRMDTKLTNNHWTFQKSSRNTQSPLWGLSYVLLELFQ